MDAVNVVAIVTYLVTFVLGALSKKSKYISNKLIPLQNLLIGVIVAGIEWYITKDYNAAIFVSGILAGGTYDIFHNLNKLTNKEE